jgi:hypothetical protein
LASLTEDRTQEKKPKEIWSERQAFWSMHVEAMNWSGMGNAAYAAELGLSPYALRIWRNRFAHSGEEMNWRFLFIRAPGPQLSSAANCVRRKYRLTMHARLHRHAKRARWALHIDPGTSEEALVLGPFVPIPSQECFALEYPVLGWDSAVSS